MLALEIAVNGKRLYTVGVGEFGMLKSGVEWARIAQNKGTVYEHLWVGATAYSGSPVMADHWQNHPLKVGDEVSIRIVDTDAPDDPLPGLPDYPGTEE